MAGRFEATRRAVLTAERDPAALREEVRSMREKVRGARPVPQGRFDVKHSPGGMMDVEFAVQLLQIKHGQDLRVRTTETAVAIDALAAHVDALTRESTPC